MKAELTSLTFKGQVVLEKTYGWYEFHQNNSGGFFEVNDDVAPTVLIQAGSAKEANSKAQEIGIYFDGCRDGRDCNCCGDRWREAHGALKSFEVFGLRKQEMIEHINVRDFAKTLANENFADDPSSPQVILYYADGSVERYYQDAEVNK